MTSIDTMRPNRDKAKARSIEAEQEFHRAHDARKSASHEMCENAGCRYCGAVRQALDHDLSAGVPLGDVETAILTTPAETVSDVALKLEIMCDMAPLHLDPDVGANWFPEMRTVAAELKRLSS